MSTGRSRVAVIGLGIMGSAFARQLLQARHRVSGFDPDVERAAASHRQGVAVAADCSTAVADADLVLLSLPNNAALDGTVTELIRTRGAARDGLIVVELSTLDVECKSRNRRRLDEHGITLLDCPVSGTGAQAEDADIVVYASGDEAALRNVESVLRDFSRDVFFLGTFGNGMRMKLIANLLVAVHNVATAEALGLAKKSGIDPDVFCEVIGAGVAQSRILELRAPLMAGSRYAPATMRLDLWQKDMALIESFARDIGAPTPLFDATVPLYETALRRGLGQLDTAAVFEVLANLPHGKLGQEREDRRDDE